MGLRLPPNTNSSMTTYEYHVVPLHVSYAATTLRNVPYVPTTSLGPRVLDHESWTTSLGPRVLDHESLGPRVFGPRVLSNHASYLMSLHHHVP
jgi:hypothetical protein